MDRHWFQIQIKKIGLTMDPDSVSDSVSASLSASLLDSLSGSVYSVSDSVLDSVSDFIIIPDSDSVKWFHIHTIFSF